MDESGYIEELIRRSGDDLDEALALIGLYTTEKAVVGREGPGGVQFAVALTGDIGSVAFNRRVQDPEGSATDDVFSEVTENLEREEADETSRLFRERLAGFGKRQPEDPSGEDRERA
jgi:hypothetical protein